MKQCELFSRTTTYIGLLNSYLKLEHNTMFFKINLFPKLLRICTNTHYTIRTYASVVKHKKRNEFYDPYFETSINGSTPSVKVGGLHLVTMAKGVGTGPELMEIVKEVFNCIHAPVMFEELDIVAVASDDYMDNMIISIMRNGVAIKGNIEKELRPITTPKNIKLNQSLNLITNLMEFKNYPGVQLRKTPGLEVDIALVRGNLEGEFGMLEHVVNPSAVEHLKITTKVNSEGLARFAFKFAEENKKIRVVTVYSKGVHEEGEALFIDSCKTIAKNYPSLPHKVQTIGSFLRDSVTDYNKNVIVASSLGGEMISSILAGHIGSNVLTCGCNYGSSYAVFEPGARQRGLKLAGKNIVNPISMLMAGVKLLRYLKHDKFANDIENAINQTINIDRIMTKDLGGSATTREVVDNILDYLKKTVAAGRCYRAKPKP